MTSPRELMNRQRELRAIGGSRNGDQILLRLILKKISAIFATTPFDEPITLTCNVFTALQRARFP